MKPASLSPLATLVAEGTTEELEAYFRNARQLEVPLENTLLPEEKLQEVIDFLGIEEHPFFGEGTITLHGEGTGMSTLERAAIQDYLRRSLEL